MKAIYLLPLLLCTPCSAAFINPIGGSWTDGAAVVEFVEQEVRPNGRRQWLSYVDTDSGRLLSDVRLFTYDGRSRFWVSNSVDFSDGGRLAGEFAFWTSTHGLLDVSTRTGEPMDTFIDGVPTSQVDELLLPGRHVLSWGFNRPVVGETFEKSIHLRAIPEPCTGLGILLALGVLLIYGKLGW